MSSYMAQVIGIKVGVDEVLSLLSERDPAFYQSLCEYIDPEDLAVDPKIQPQNLIELFQSDKSMAYYYLYSALQYYQGQALYGLTVTADYMGQWYLGHVFNVVELAFMYKGKAPSRYSFSVKELSEEIQWTEFFLRKLGVLANHVVEFHNTLHDGKFDLPVKA
jgi:hypothetical protein